MRHPLSLTTPGGTIEVAVLDEHDHPQPLFRRFDGRMFAAGVPGRPYQLQVRNLTGSRVEVIVSVDGCDVLKKQDASPYDSQGLVIPAHASYVFRGWRFDDQETGQFVFCDPGNSAAVQVTGSTENLGVIGFAAWREAYRRPDVFLGSLHAPDYGNESYSAVRGGGARGMMSASNAAAPVASASIGTGVGERQHDPVSHTTFSRAAGEPDSTVVGYDTHEELDRLGIIRPADPDAWPGARTGYDQLLTVPGHH